MKDFSIVVLVIFLGLLMTCCYMLALVNAENTQSQQQQHISVSWVTMQSNRITSSSPVKQRLPNSVWNRNVWYSWVQVMIWWPRWHMLNTHTHTNTSKSWLTHCFHPPPIVMPWLFEASQTLRQDMEGEGEILRKRRRERETDCCAWWAETNLPFMIVQKKKTIASDLLWNFHWIDASCGD